MDLARRLESLSLKTVFRHTADGECRADLEGAAPQLSVVISTDDKARRVVIWIMEPTLKLRGNGVPSDPVNVDRAARIMQLAKDQFPDATVVRIHPQRGLFGP
ncbi:MAG: hypothetical protein JSS29_17215 [Proteobacteria bacterium]|nr:hypothetical protein [Pseudomonadota bacterium]